jgi:succinate dehydrogenase / fumarate reductase flavoprotein subunit
VSVNGNREFNPGWHTALDLDNLLTVAEAVTRSAIERRESRGGHFRDDFPEKDPTYAGFNILATRNADGAMNITRQPIEPIRDDLKQIIEENK